MSEGFQLNSIEKEVKVGLEDLKLNGILAMPRDAKAIVVFAHGSGSGRLSPRNQFVARVLQDAKLGTLLMDLLSDEESLDRRNVFDIQKLSERLSLAKNWLLHKDHFPNMKIGYFGASTGAGAALVSAAQNEKQLYAVVSRGGRPDLAGGSLSKVKVPTLLIVGGNDGVVIDLNQDALEKLNCEKEIKIVPGATHLFEEPGTLEQVAELAKDWFIKYL